MSSQILLVGCGNMGFAMLKGWLASDQAPEAYVVEPLEALRDRAAGVGAAVFAAAADLPEDLAPALIFMAVKPQVMGDVLPDYTRFAGAEPTFVSVAAGTMIGTLADALPGPTPIIRCMPNTPAALGVGMLVCCPNDHVSVVARDYAGGLLKSSGEVAWIEDERLMDAVTAVSGSGPAYIFNFIECLAAAGEKAGLPSGLAAKLALQTVYGAGLLAAESADEPATLRKQVTSPKGTTAAALDVLMAENGLAPLLSAAVEAARARGEELAQG